MLHSNSRQAKQNIRAYIMDNFDFSGYEIKEPKTFQETALVILSTFRSEKFYSSSRMNEALLFEDWAARFTLSLEYLLLLQPLRRG